MSKPNEVYRTKNHIVIEVPGWFTVFTIPYDKDAQGYIEVYGSTSFKDCLDWLTTNEFEPADPEESLDELIVCAANKDPDTGVVYPCVRHGCEIFWGLIDAQFTEGKNCVHFVQGFLTNRRRFVDRYEAYKIATTNHQIRRRCPTGSNRLYSEMLY